MVTADGYLGKSPDTPPNVFHASATVFCFALGRQMKFILVNGRTPRPRPFCVCCDQSIGTGYLREIGTHLTYCDHDCYADHCKSAFVLLENQATAS
jgi:hypothetical protein